MPRQAGRRLRSCCHMDKLTQGTHTWEKLQGCGWGRVLAAMPVCKRHRVTSVHVATRRLSPRCPQSSGAVSRIPF